MRTERWVPIAGAKQYRLYDGYVTNYHIGLCKNPDAMCDAIIGNLRTTKEILNYAAGFKTGIEIEKTYAWRKLNNDWEGYGSYSV